MRVKDLVSGEVPIRRGIVVGLGSIACVERAVLVPRFHRYDGCRLELLVIRAHLLVVACCAVMAFGCRSGEPPRKKAPQSQERAPAREVAGEAQDRVILPDSIRWHSWEAGLARARAESKPMMVVVYADWCPKCRALGPVFEDPQIAALAERLVMVRQDHDAAPAWLKPFNEKYGGYVPRIFFFTPDGKIRENVTSGHPRYPYFYAASHVNVLKRSMRQAIGS